MNQYLDFELPKKSYNNFCWWCGKPANTGEHKIKKTDIKDSFAEHLNNGNKLAILNIDKNQSNPFKIIQGANSDNLKYKNVICSDCNNSRSAEMDLAYTEFRTYLRNNFAQVQNEQIIDLKNIFNINWFEKKKDVFRYIVKHLCCRLAINDIKISKNLIDFLNGDGILSEVNFMFQWKIYALKFGDVNLESQESIYIGRLEHYFNDKTLVALSSYFTVEQMAINFLYSKNALTRLYSETDAFFKESKIKFEKIDYSSLINKSFNFSRNELFLDYIEEFPFSTDTTGLEKFKVLSTYIPNLSSNTEHTLI